MLEQRGATERIRDVVENWAVFRDAGDWTAFATVWHDDGWMTATWFQGSAADFIQASRAGFEAGVNILHFLGGTSAEVRGARAIAQTKMTIQQRAEVHGAEVDVTCTGRFYDFFEERDGRGRWCAASRSTRRTGWTWWTPPDQFSLTGPRWTATRSATGTWHTCSGPTGTTSCSGCPGCAAPRWSCSTPRAPSGWPAPPTPARR